MTSQSQASDLLKRMTAEQKQNVPGLVKTYRLIDAYEQSKKKPLDKDAEYSALSLYFLMSGQEALPPVDSEDTEWRRFIMFCSSLEHSYIMHYAWEPNRLVTDFPLSYWYFGFVYPLAQRAWEIWVKHDLIGMSNSEEALIQDTTEQVLKIQAETTASIAEYLLVIENHHEELKQIEPFFGLGIKHCVKIASQRAKQRSTHTTNQTIQQFLGGDFLECTANYSSQLESLITIKYCKGFLAGAKKITLDLYVNVQWDKNAIGEEAILCHAKNIQAGLEKLLANTFPKYQKLFKQWDF